MEEAVLAVSVTRGMSGHDIGRKMVAFEWRVRVEESLNRNRSEQGLSIYKTTYFGSARTGGGRKSGRGVVIRPHMHSKLDEVALEKEKSTSLYI